MAIDFDVQLRTRNFRSGAGIPAVLLKAFLLSEEVVLVGRERPVGCGRGERMKEARKKRGVVKFVENVDGEEGVFRVTHAAELDAFRVVPGGGKHDLGLGYVNFTREGPELFGIVGKLWWLQMEY